MSRFIKWRGREVFNKVELAAARGIDRVMADSVVEAKDNHPFINRTGQLEGSIRIVDAALEAKTNVIVGRWGVVDVLYARFVELGSDRAKEFPFLRPAADNNYPNLAKFIRQEFRGI